MSANFTPINRTASSWGEMEPGVTELTDDNEQEITDLLLGHKVVKVDDEHLMLDNGTVVKAIGHDGCGGCPAGWYELSVLNGVDNIITKVEFDYRPTDDYNEGADRSGHPDDPGDKWTGYYRIFVFAEDQRINLMQFDGTDGNGYYGTGYSILVRPA